MNRLYDLRIKCVVSLRGERKQEKEIRQNDEKKRANDISKKRTIQFDVPSKELVGKSRSDNLLCGVGYISSRKMCVFFKYF